MSPPVSVPPRPAVALPPVPRLRLFGRAVRVLPGLWAWPLMLTLVFVVSVMAWLRAVERTDVEAQRAAMISDALSLEAQLHGRLESELTRMKVLAEAMQAGDPAEEIASAALRGDDSLAERTIQWFLALYGAEAGNVALKLFATGGVYLGGGIAPKLASLLPHSRFVERFQGKGRMQPLLERIAISIVLNDKGGEPTQIEIYDGKEENYILINTKEKKITIESKTGDILIKAKEKVRIEAKNIETDSQQATKSKAGTNYEIQASANIKYQAGGNMDLTAGGVITGGGSVFFAVVRNIGNSNGKYTIQVTKQ